MSNIQKAVSAIELGQLYLYWLKNTFLRLEVWPKNIVEFPLIPAWYQKKTVRCHSATGFKDHSVWTEDSDLSGYTRKIPTCEAVVDRGSIR